MAGRAWLIPPCCDGRLSRASVIDSAFAGVTLDPAVLAFDRRQRGTFRKSFEEYAATRVIPARITAPEDLCSRHPPSIAATGAVCRLPFASSE